MNLFSFKVTFVAVTFFLFAGCSDKSGLLTRTWMVENLKYSKEIPAEMQPAIEQSVAQMKAGFRITYNTDGTYNTQMNENRLDGKWKLNWNSSKISVVTNGGESKDYEVLDLSETKFSFKAIEAGEEVIFEMIPEK